MPNHQISIDTLRNSFNTVYDGPDRLQREYEMAMEAERLGIHIDIYRRLYELRREEKIDPYPKPKKWWHAPGEWGKWVWHLPFDKKKALVWKGTVKVVQSGVVITAVVGIGRYILEAPKREKLAHDQAKQAHYQAWQIINLATGQKTSGGRIEALQDLVKDGVSLQGLDASDGNLTGIKLPNTDLRNTNLARTDLRSLALLMPTLVTPTSLVPTLIMLASPMPNLTVPTLAMPTLKMPNLKMPNLTVPTLKMPTSAMPSLVMPTSPVPSLVMPTLAVPPLTVLVMRIAPTSKVQKALPQNK